MWEISGLFEGVLASGGLRSTEGTDNLLERRWSALWAPVQFVTQWTWLSADGGHIEQFSFASVYST